MPGRLISAVFAFTILLAGCAQMGNRFDESKVSELQPGVSTIADAEAKLGPPTSQSATADGSTLLQWMFSFGTGVGVGGGAHVAILFGPDGKMIRVTHEFATGTEQGSFGAQPLPGNKMTLGIFTAPVTPALAQANKMGSPRGLLIARVMPGSPADRAGLVQGDIMLSYAGKTSVADIMAAVGAHGAQDVMTIWRGGQEQTITVNY